MRHRKRRTKLSMMSGHRKAMLKAMSRSLLIYERVKTTLRRAKEARRMVEKIITMSKTDTVASRRQVYTLIPDRTLIMRLFKDIAPLFKDRTSGFTRIIPAGFRRGDGAQMAYLELTEKTAIIEKKPSKKKEEKKAAPQDKHAADQKAEPHKEEHRKDEHPSAPKPKKTTVAEDKKAERARAEEKRIGDSKNFMKNLRGFFRRKTDM